jgi:hypothetical protein
VAIVCRSWVVVCLSGAANSIIKPRGIARQGSRFVWSHHDNNVKWPRPVGMDLSESGSQQSLDSIPPHGAPDLSAHGQTYAGIPRACWVHVDPEWSRLATLSATKEALKLALLTNTHGPPGWLGGWISHRHGRARVGIAS